MASRRPGDQRLNTGSYAYCLLVASTATGAVVGRVDTATVDLE